MTQRELAQATGIAQPNDAAYESGRRPLTDAARLRIEQATARRPSERVTRHRDRLVIEFQRGITLVGMAALQRELTALLGCEVDIVSASAHRKVPRSRGNGPC